MVGGGSSNSVVSGALNASVLGGSSNRVTAQFGVIAGGSNNLVSGNYSSVLNGQNNSLLGGSSNTASAGTSLFVAGSGIAVANGSNSVLLTQGSTISIALDNSLLVGGGVVQPSLSSAVVLNMSGGTTGGVMDNCMTAMFSGANTRNNAFEFYTSAPVVTNAPPGAFLAASSGSWGIYSERALKTADIVTLDAAEIARRALNIPLYNYRYKGPPGQGTMVEDFDAALAGPDARRGILGNDVAFVALACAQTALREVQRIAGSFRQQ